WAPARLKNVGPPRESKENRVGSPRESKKNRSADPREIRDAKKQADAAARKVSRANEARRARIDELETRIAKCEAAIREIELSMAAPGFYDDRAAAQPVVDRHQALMWEVGDLMHQWEQLQSVGLPAASQA